MEFFSTRERLVDLRRHARPHQRGSESPSAVADLAERVRLGAGGRSRAATPRARRRCAHCTSSSSRRSSARMLDGVRALVVVPHGALTYLPLGGAARAPRRRGALSRGALRDRDAPRRPRRCRRFSRANGVATAAGRERARSPSRPSCRRAEPRRAVVAATYARRRRPLVGGAATEACAAGRARPLRHRARRQSRPVRCAEPDVLRHPARHREAARVAPTTTGVSRRTRCSRCPCGARSSSSRAARPRSAPRGAPASIGRDDYVTLAQAFLFAGAQNVVATLWRIEDRSAAEFAGPFYSRARRALAGGSACRRRSARLSGAADIGRPYYWAGYVVSGSGVLR